MGNFYLKIIFLYLFICDGNNQQTTVFSLTMLLSTVRHSRRNIIRNINIREEIKKKLDATAIYTLLI